MSDLLDKLNLLVRSSVNNLVGNSLDRLSASLPKGQPDKAIEHHVADLRQRIEDALTTEDKMQQHIDQLQQQAGESSQQADQALQNGDEASARTFIQQQQRQQQQATMLQSELDQHKQATSQLIEQVNQLDALSVDARQAKQPDEPAPAVSATESQPAAESGIPIKVRIEQTRQQPNDPPDDLAQRRARLSKPE